MDVVAVRTKLQAAIVHAMVQEGLVRVPFHLVKLYMAPVERAADELDIQCRALVPFVARTTMLDRSKVGAIGACVYLALLLAKTRLTGSRVLVANLNWLPLALALRLVPGSQIHSFDDGSANVQLRDNSYLSEQPTQRAGLAGWVLRALFPKGCAFFARGRIASHCTIFAGLDNVVPESRLTTVRMRWESLLTEQDARALPAGVRRIFLGSVYGELNEWLHPRVTPTDVDAAVAWADLHIPHPRQAIRGERHPILMKYPAESVISHYAAGNDVVVAHYNSSVALSLRSDTRVSFVDLSGADVASVLATQASSPLPSA